MEIFIENQSGTTQKMEHDESLGRWVEVGHLAVPYPYPYGFITGTLQEDGYPLDAFLILQNIGNVNRGDKYGVYPIGLVEYYEDDERDFKILVTTKQNDFEVTEEIKETIKQFLLHAFDNNPNKRVRFGGFFGRDKAEEEIEKCRVLHQ